MCPKAYKALVDNVMDMKYPIFISGPDRHTGRASRRKRTMRFNLHGEVLLDGEVGGAAGAKPSSSAKKLSSAPVLLTR
jgi:hypothetical protein